MASFATRQPVAHPVLNITLKSGNILSVYLLYIGFDITGTDLQRFLFTLVKTMLYMYEMPNDETIIQTIITGILSDSMKTNENLFNYLMGKNPDFCGPRMSTRYLTSSHTSQKYVNIFITSHQGNVIKLLKEQVLHSAVTFSIEPGNKLYIDALCAAPKQNNVMDRGGWIIMKILNLTCVNFGITKIELSSIDSVETLSFYDRMGYKPTQINTSLWLIDMTRPVIQNSRLANFIKPAIVLNNARSKFMKPVIAKRARDFFGDDDDEEEVVVISDDDDDGYFEKYAAQFRAIQHEEKGAMGKKRKNKSKKRLTKNHKRKGKSKKSRK